MEFNNLQVKHQSDETNKKIISIAMIIILIFNSMVFVTASSTPSAPGAPSASPSAPLTGISTSVSDLSGSLNLGVTMNVPAYHGLEPKIGISYDSNSSNGLLGVGWNLSASSVIQRGVAGGGTPNYDSSDIYYLDGQELVSDTSMGGTHSLKHKNYTRISFDSANSQWNIWSKDGTKSTYTKLFETSKGVYRWALATVVDTLGNQVNYSYTGDANSEYYINKITYNGTEISFYTEARSDIVTSATGASLASLNNRLKTIDIKVSGIRVRAYKLTYKISSDTERSVLTSIQEFGSDAALDASNTVTGGTALPAITIEAQSIDFNGNYNITGQDTGWGWDNEHRWFPGDVNGDGKTDFIFIAKHGIHDSYTYDHVCLHAAISNGDGTYNLTAQDTTWGWSEEHHWFSGDVNGDGKTDIMFVAKHGVHDSYTHDHACLHTAISRGDGTFDLKGQDTTWGWDSQHKWLSGDMNGDGKSDIMFVAKHGPHGAYTYDHVALHTAISKGDGTYTLAGQDTGWGWNNEHKWFTGDMNGDGRTDFMFVAKHGPHDSYTYDHVCLHSAVSKGDGTYNLTGQDTTWGWNEEHHWFPGDVNGDGKTDFMFAAKHDPHGSYTHAHVALHSAISRGDGNYTLTGQDTTWGWSIEHKWFSGDINGDGRTDFMFVAKHGPHDSYTYDHACLHSAVSKGDGNYRLTGEDTGWGWDKDHEWFAGDINGDGKTDIMFSAKHGAHGSYTYEHVCLHGAITRDNGNKIPDLVNKVTTSTDGKITANYVSSAKWPNRSVPEGILGLTVERLTVEDGRGNIDTTNYTYSGQKIDVANQINYGFKYVKKTINNAGDYIETNYIQDNKAIAPGTVQSTYIKNSAGSLYSGTTYEYTTNGSAPYTTLLSKEEHTTYDVNNNNSFVTAYSQYSYDSYGNKTQEINFGDKNKTGDEKTITTNYLYNTSKYIVGSPEKTITYKGTNTGGTKVSESISLYDGSTTLGTLPSKGMVTEIRVWNDKTNTYIATKYDYDIYGNVLKVTDPKGISAEYTYDTSKRIYLLSAKNSLGHTATYTWDLNLGRLTKITDINGNDTTYTYDSLARLLTASTADGGKVTYEYISFGSPTAQKVKAKVDDGTTDGLWSETYYDGLGRAYATKAEGDINTRTDYFEATTSPLKIYNAYKTGDALKVTQYQYDGLGRALKVTYPDGTFVQNIYGANKTTNIDANGNKREITVDVYGSTIEAKEVNGSNSSEFVTTTYIYDILGNLLEINDPNGKKTTIKYDSLGRKTEFTDVYSGTTTYTYDDLGNLTKTIDANNVTVEYTYDALNRIKEKRYSDGTKVIWNYDETTTTNGKGKMTSVTFPGGSAKVSAYDKLGRIVSQSRTVDTTTANVGYTYDIAGRLKTVTYPDSEVVTYNYDATGRLSSINGYVNSFSYDIAGNMTSAVLANGVTENYTYDANSLELKTIGIAKGTTNIFDSSYTYDNGKRITAITSTSNNLANISLSYDYLNRLKAVSNKQAQTFSYDKVGNITNNSKLGTYSYTNTSRPYAVTAAGGKSFTYDNVGNMLTGDGRTYVWNPDNLTKQITIGTEVTSFVYDENGDRVKKNGKNGTTYYFGKVSERDASGFTNYIYAGSKLIAKKTPDSKKYWYHNNHLGSVAAITDSTGTPVKKMDYDVLGKVIGATGTLKDSRQFAETSNDSETGLDYMGARYYSSDLGRFISTDTILPIGNLTGSQIRNRYSYANNNPISNIDPSGHLYVSKSGLTQDTNKWAFDSYKKMNTMLVKSNYESQMFSAKLNNNSFQAYNAQLTYNYQMKAINSKVYVPEPTWTGIQLSAPSTQTPSYAASTNTASGSTTTSIISPVSAASSVGSSAEVPKQWSQTLDRIGSSYTVGQMYNLGGTIMRNTAIMTPRVDNTRVEHSFSGSISGTKGPVSATLVGGQGLTFTTPSGVSMGVSRDGRTLELNGGYNWTLNNKGDDLVGESIGSMGAYVGIFGNTRNERGIDASASVNVGPFSGSFGYRGTVKTVPYPSNNRRGF